MSPLSTSVRSARGRHARSRHLRPSIRSTRCRTVQLAIPHTHSHTLRSASQRRSTERSSSSVRIQTIVRRGRATASTAEAPGSCGQRSPTWRGSSNSGRPTRGRTTAQSGRRALALSPGLPLGCSRSSRGAAPSFAWERAASPSERTARSAFRREVMRGVNSRGCCRLTRTARARVHCVFHLHRSSQRRKRRRKRLRGTQRRRRHHHQSS